MFNFLTQNILTRAFWGDEAWTALISALPIPDLIKTTAADFHPPLYYLIVHFWMNFFGNGEVALRSISIIFWILSGFIALLFARSLNLRKLFTIYFLLFTIFNPFVFIYAFETRNYTLFIFLSLLSNWQFYEILKAKRVSHVNSFFYVLATILGVYTHYYMFFFVAAQFLFIAISRKDLWKLFTIYFLLFAILYSPWLPFFLSQTKSVAGGYWIPPVTYETVRDTFKVLIRGEQYTSFAPKLPDFFILYLGMAAVWALKTKRLFTKETLIFVFAFVIPFLSPVIVSQVRPIFFYRYLVPTAIPLTLLPLWWLGGQVEKKSHLEIQKILTSIVPLVFLAIFVFTNTTAFVSRMGELFRPILARVSKDANTGEVIYTRLPSFAEVVYYNNKQEKPLPVHVIPEGLAQASGKALLDTYVSRGYLSLKNPDKKESYWLLEEGPKYKLIRPN